MEVVETCEKRTLSSVEPSTERSFPSIDEEVVGFMEDAENIIKKLTGGTKDMDVLSIYGMPGLGKTTLAGKVYNNPSIVNHFDVRVWCSVSQTYNRRTLLVEIFKQTTPGKSEIKEDVDVIADMLRKKLIGRRYLIVLDDIWEVEAWEDVGLCFPNNENGSRVIVTTRIEEVAKNLQHRSDPYSLRFLTVEESWELLKKKVFRGETCPLNLVEAGLQVAKHCKGLPLVVVLISGIIAKMEREASLWLEVANDLSSYVLEEQSMKVIQTSYDHLGNHLKPCLLYMGLFPEDFEIRVYDLLKLWIAEEFVLNAETENMEEASRVCLSNLLNRSLVMVSRNKFNGDIKSCILHDVVREFCLRKLTEEKFMQIIVPYSPYQHSCPTESRLCIYMHDDLDKQLDHSDYQLNKVPMFQSAEEAVSLELIAHPEFNKRINRSDPLSLPVKLRFVRVLNLMYVELPNSWATAISSFPHLRYLALRVEQFEFKWISHLHNLQTLHIESARTLHLRAANLWEMRKLRHVKINDFSLVWEDNDRESFEESSPTMLENLKTFGSYQMDMDDMAPRFWWRFPNIEEFTIRIINVPKFPLFPIVEVHTRLLSLVLVMIPFGFWDSVGWESYFVFPSNLRHLRIAGSFLTKEIVSNIATLQKLESLELVYGFILKEEDQCWDVTDVVFPALKYLKLQAIEMDEWKASEESFPVLEKLYIKDSYSYEAIPPCFADIPTLRFIKLDNCNDSLRDSAMNIKKEIEEYTGCDRLQVL